GTEIQRYQYDANGNRLSLTTPSGAVAATYDPQDRLLTYGTKSYTYTPEGRLRSETDSATNETTAYTYDHFDNLTRVDLPDGRIVEYLIDGQNRRVGKKIDGVLVEGFIYSDQLRPVAKVDGDGNTVERYVYGTNINVPEYIVEGNVTYRLITDHLG